MSHWQTRHGTASQCTDYEQTCQLWCSPCACCAQGSVAIFWGVFILNRRHSPWPFIVEQIFTFSTARNVKSSCIINLSVLRHQRFTHNITHTNIKQILCQFFLSRFFWSLPTFAANTLGTDLILSLLIAEPWMLTCGLGWLDAFFSWTVHFATFCACAESYQSSFIWLFPTHFCHTHSITHCWENCC